MRSRINLCTAGTRSHPENQFITLFKCTLDLRAAAAGHLDRSAVCFVGVAVDFEGHIWQSDGFRFFRGFRNILRKRVKR